MPGAGAVHHIIGERAPFDMNEAADWGDFPEHSYAGYLSVHRNRDLRDRGARKRLPVDSPDFTERRGR
jgi:hypothetical protein